MSQFTLFSDLPQELQDQIWDAAIRDDGPAAQFFTIYDPRWDKNTIVPLAMRVEGMRYGKDQYSHLALAAPQSTSDHGDESWVDGNESAYMIDSGLWTACWASRKRMLWHFRPAETSATMSRLGPVRVRKAWEVCQRPTASVTMPFQRDNGERQYLTIRPMEDLLVFQYAMNSQVNPPKGQYWKTLKDFPPFRWRRRSGGWHSPLHVRNIAVQYKREGMWDILGPTARDIAGLEGFWFVDYNLQRRYRVGNDAQRRDRQRFRAGDDSEFVQVLQTDEEWWDTSSGDDSVGARSSPSLAFYIASILEANALIAELDERGVDIQNFYQNHYWNYTSNIPLYQVLMDAVENGEDNSEINISEDNSEINSSDEESAVVANRQHSIIRFGVLAYVKRGSEKHLPTRNEWIDRRSRTELPGKGQD